MYRTPFAALAALALLTALPADGLAKDKGDWLVRLRGLGMITDTSGTTDTLGGSARTSNDALPELDVSYFFTENIAAELILATSKHNVSVDNSTAGNLDLGTVRLLPPVVTLQYHFTPKGTFSPYLGAGINLTIPYDANSGTSVNSVDYSTEVGWALQAGMDYKITDKWSFNLDLKKVFVATDIKVNGGAINANGTDLDPWVVGAGFGYRF